MTIRIGIFAANEPIPSVIIAKGRLGDWPCDLTTPDHMGEPQSQEDAGQHRHQAALGQEAEATGPGGDQ